jgi:acyl-CoA dehydrogenase-like protein
LLGRSGARAAEIDAQSIFAVCRLEALSTLGVMGLNLPAAFGGASLDPCTLFEAIASIAGACASTASMVTAHFLATDSIQFGGEEAQKTRWLAEAASGRSLGAFALTEPGAGSNPTDMTTTTRRDGAWPPERTMGLRGGHVFEVRLDCLAPEDRRLGPERLWISHHAESTRRRAARHCRLLRRDRRSRAIACASLG